MYVPRTRQFWAVAIGHFANDTVMSTIPVLLVFINANVLPLETVVIGLIVGVMQLLGALSQPFFGLLADRIGGRWPGGLGLAWTAVMLLTGLLLAGRGLVLPMALVFIAAGLGSGALHPAGMKHAAESHLPREASNMAWFFLAGQLGLAFGPALAGHLLENAGAGVGAAPASAMPAAWATLLALPGVCMMLFFLPGRRAHREALAAAPVAQGGRTALTRATLLVILLFVAMITLRSLAQIGVVTFIPLLFQQKGWSPADYGLITSIFWVGSGLAGVFFGGLADRYDRRHVIAVSMLCSAPPLFLLPVVDGASAFALAVLAGVLSGASHSIVVVLAQGLLPASRAMASGAVLGLIFGTGALGSALTGWLADRIGLANAFQVMTVTIVLASLLALLLPRPARAKTKEKMAAPARV